MVQSRLWGRAALWLGLMVAAAYAGETGKIAGRVLDETGEPFPVKDSDVGKVDLAIAGAHAGAPSLTIQIDKAEARWTPPATTWPASSDPRWAPL